MATKYKPKPRKVSRLSHMGNRVFDGMRFTYVKWKQTKKEAQKYADGIRVRGNHARVIKTAEPGYLIFMGPKNR